METTHENATIYNTYSDVVEFNMYDSQPDIYIYIPTKNPKTMKSICLPCCSKFFVHDILDFRHLGTW